MRERQIYCSVFPFRRFVMADTAAVPSAGSAPASPNVAPVVRAHWFPLESNPAVMTRYMHRLGVDAAASPLQFHDVLGLDPELLAMVPSPVVAVLLLFPVTAESERAARELCAGLTPPAAGDAASTDKSPFFIAQTVPNACGTIGILHALANNTPSWAKPATAGGNAPPTFLERFLSATSHSTPLERAHFLAEDPGLAEAHTAAASEGQSAPPGREDEVDLHFVCFVQKGGTLWELDGRKPFPIPRGPCGSDGAELLSAAASTIQSCYMALAPESNNFCVTALSMGAGEEW